MQNINNLSMEELLGHIREVDEKMSPEEKLKLLRQVNVLVKDIDADVVELKQQIDEEKRAEEILGKIQG